MYNKENNEGEINLIPQDVIFSALSEISSKMEGPQRKEYEELARKRQYFFQMMTLMTNKMTQSQKNISSN